MTKVGLLVRSAFREGNIIPVGQQPKPAELEEGLDVFNQFVLSTFNFYVGSKLIDWQVPRSQRTGSVKQQFPLAPGAHQLEAPFYVNYAPANTRIVWDGSAQQIYFTETPQDGAAMGLVAGSGAAAAGMGELVLDANGRTFAYGSAQLSFPDLYSVDPLRWFYRADLGQWVTVKSATADDECLFPLELDDLWICAVSTRLAPRYGKQVSPSTVARGNEMMTVLKSRYAQQADTRSGGENVLPTYDSFPRPSSWMR